MIALTHAWAATNALVRTRTIGFLHDQSSLKGGRFRSRHWNEGSGRKYYGR